MSGRRPEIWPGSALVAISVGLCPGQALATSPVQPEGPAEYLGAWRVVSGTRQCVLTLGDAPGASGIGWLIDDGQHCLANWGLRVSGWRLESDGVALVAPDRSTVVFFSRTGQETYESVGGGAMTLSRPASR